MLTTTRDMIMPTAITGSYPRPLWYDASLQGRSFKTMLGNSLFREQYLDAVAAIINAQEAAGLDIVTDGDSRFDLAVGGKSWFFYPIERLGGVTRPPRHLARLDGAPRRGTAARQNPVGGAGGLSARGRHRKTDPRPARIHRDLAGRAAPDRQPGQVRRDLRPRPRQHAVGRALPRRQGAGARSVRHHERRVQGIGGRRLPGDPGRGAAPSRPDDPARLHGQRPRIPDRGVQPPARRGRGRDLGALLLGQPEPAAGLLGGAELRARPAPPAATQLRRHHLRMRLAPTARTCRSSPSTRPTRRSASASSATPTRSSSRPSTSRA